jgi:integrase
MRGQGRVYRPKVRGRSTQLWWLDYSVGGRRHREPSGMRAKADAQRLLRERMGERESGKLIGNPAKVTLSELLAQLEQRYSLKENKSLRRAKQAFDHLERILGAERRLSDLTQDVVNDYLQRRVDDEEGARSTANYEVSVLNSALSQAVENRVLAVRPRFKLPRVRNTRQGFFTEGEFAAVLLGLPEDVRPVVQFLHATGWRLNEALKLTWDQVDWEGLVITISGDKTKGEDDRVFPFGVAPELKQLPEARWEARVGVFVFHRSGERIKTFIKSWRTACRRAGVAGRLVHDLRRTAARNFRRVGIDEGTIMKLCGWKTRAMFDRYNVIDPTDLSQAVAKRFNGKQAANASPHPQQQPSVSPSSTR